MFRFFFCKPLTKTSRTPYRVRPRHIKFFRKKKKPFVFVQSVQAGLTRIKNNKTLFGTKRWFVGYFSTLKKIFVFTNLSNSLTTKLLLEFKLRTTQFIKYNLNRTIINYNIKGIYTPQRFLQFNYLVKKKRLNNFYKNQSRLDIALKRRKQMRRKKTLRRVPSFWVSKITQKSLTPLRRDFNILHRKKLKYQHRLTSYVLHYYKFKVLELVNLSEFALESLLLRSKLISTQILARFFIKKNYIFVNGLLVSKPQFVVSKGDVIQLLLQIKVLLFLRWNALLAFQKTKKFYYYLKKWRARSFRPYPKTPSRRIPSWIRKCFLYREPIPLFMEVDFLTMSVIVLYNWTTDFFNYHYLSFNMNSWATVRPINWKSLT